MIRFTSDYMEGAHPAILERLIAINLEKNTGYGADSYCKSASDKIRKACCKDAADVVFLVGGTQTNAFVIDAVLDKCDGVLTVESGHIALHESGAIEAWGHKVLTVPAVDGKITAKAVADYVEGFYSDGSYEHMVAPGMVYISNPTEIGTLYSYAELKDIKTVCEQFKLPLYVDGARLGYGLASPGYDVDMARLAECCDVFYIGGTKVGALFGEALVITDKSLIRKKVPLMKRHGALLAKGWLLGVQFDTLFTDDLYLHISRNAIDKALKIKKMFTDKGYRLFTDSMTNQQFFIVPKTKLEQLKKDVEYTEWSEYDADNMVIRLVASWATTDAQIAELAEYV